MSCLLLSWSKTPKAGNVAFDTIHDYLFTISNACFLKPNKEPESRKDSADTLCKSITSVKEGRMKTRLHRGKNYCFGQF